MENEIEKQISVLHELQCKCVENGFYGDIELAEKACQKQIPKQIIINSDGYYPQCPSCKLEIGEFHKVKYCPFCGQALFWGHTNEQ